MTKDLDSRIADLGAKRRANGTAAAVDANRDVAELNEAVRCASISVGELNAWTDLTNDRASRIELRIRHIWIFVSVGVVAVIVTSIFVVAFALWSGARLKAAAENEAVLLRDTYAAEIELARQDGEAALYELQFNLARQSEVAAEQLKEIGSELEVLTGDRDAIRLELEHFIELRDRVGIELVSFRGRTVVVVPEGARLRRWRAEELSEIAHLNGRMYRFSD